MTSSKFKLLIHINLADGRVLVDPSEKSPALTRPLRCINLRSVTDMQPVSNKRSQTAPESRKSPSGFLTGTESVLKLPTSLFAKGASHVTWAES